MFPLGPVLAEVWRALTFAPIFFKDEVVDWIVVFECSRDIMIEKVMELADAETEKAREELFLPRSRKRWPTHRDSASIFATINIFLFLQLFLRFIS